MEQHHPLCARRLTLTALDDGEGKDGDCECDGGTIAIVITVAVIAAASIYGIVGLSQLCCCFDSCNACYGPACCD